VCALFLQAEPETRTIRNASNLTEHDWTSHRTEVTTVVSLRQSADKWTQGVAWVFRYSDQGLFAFRGTYSIYHRSSEQDVLYLRLMMQRSYEGMLDGDELTWTLSRRFVPEGADLEMTLDEGNRIPDQVIDASMLRGFWIDETGNEIVRRAEPTGFVQKLAGSGSLRTFQRSGFLDIGAMYRLRRGNELVDLLRGQQPPTFRLREPVDDSAKPHVTARPLTDERKREDPEQTWRGLMANRQYDDVIRSTTAHLVLQPRSIPAFVFRTLAYEKKGDIVNAGKDCTTILEIRPQWEWALMTRAGFYNQLKHYGRAKKDWLAVVAEAPTNASALNALAWALCTCPDPNERDGRQAITYALRACEESKYENADFVDTLAAAYAETGDYISAVKWQKMAVSKVGGTSASLVSKRLELYRNSIPYREQSPVVPLVTDDQGAGPE